MKRVLFVQNGDTEIEGLLADALAGAGVAIEVAHAWRGDPIPAEAGNWDGVAVGGGPMGAYETEKFPFLEDEMHLLQDARASKTPVLGICLGAQLMAAAYGGKAFPHTVKEIGVFDVTFAPEAAGDPLWHDCPRTLPTVQWHADTFTLPPGAVLLASSEITPNQLFRLDDSLYGVQFHLEIGRELLAKMVRWDTEGLWRNGVDPEVFIADAVARLQKSEEVAATVFRRWASL